MKSHLERAQLSLTDEITVDGFCGGGGWSTGFELAIGKPVDIEINGTFPIETILQMLPQGGGIPSRSAA